MSRPCVFFDRDGVVNTPPSEKEYYVLSPDRLFVEPGWLSALEVVNRRGWAAVIVTNQKCVQKGLISEEQLDAIHQKIWDVVDVERLELMAIYSAIKGDEDVDAKPNPGMLIKAAADYDLDLSRSWMIGDSQRDMEAGSRAGCAELVYVGNAEYDSHGHTVSSIDQLSGVLLEGLDAV